MPEPVRHVTRRGSARALAAATAAGACLIALAAALPLGRAQTAKPAGKTPAAPANCKAWGSKPQCCDPAVAAHLPREAIYKACGESDATFLGEQGSKETCKYVFRVEGQKEDETFVQVYAPAQKDVPASPNDPFFDWKKVGKAYVTSKAKSPKAAPMLANATGIWMPGAGYFVSVNASTKVCSKAEATRLAAAIK
ncbi:MAG TPA: hypothetical protein VMU50_04870 [Polyangia bacterium]|nr:hypothetical protein [Polyangia bacterium]